MKPTKLKIYRQGDVLIEQIAELPAALKQQKPENGRIILAHGEVTGHHHSLDVDTADWWKHSTTEEQFLTVKEGGAAVVHQEHSPIALAPGNYRVTRQREYAPEAIRNVTD